MRYSIVAMFLLLGVPVNAEDAAGSKDHPLVGRFEGSEITAYETREFDEVSIAREARKTETVEGAVTRIAYLYPADIALVQIHRNFEAAVKANGLELLLSCDQKDCGKINYDVDQFGNSPSWADAFNYRYVLAARPGDQGMIYAALFLSMNNGRARSVVTVVEETEMAFRMIDAAEMQASISNTGSVALYGVRFDTDEAIIKPESEPTLEEMAAFLKANAALSVVVVGHTDNQGSMEYNLALSAERAEAVRDALAGRYGIAGERIAHAGAGFLAPVASNATEAGRALNRRVELIAR